ncbi:MAG: M48 family metalloprotease, partial [Vulcanimicrobiota bacterium]
VDLLGRALSHGHGDTGRVLVGLGEKLLANQFSQADESEADRIGQAHLLHLGVDPQKAVSAMQRLSDLTRSGGQSRITTKIFSDHPPTADRIEALRQNAIALKAK